MTNAEIKSMIESVVLNHGFATPVDIEKSIGIDHATLCDTVEACNVRGVFRGALWGYVPST